MSAKRLTRLTEIKIPLIIIFSFFIFTVGIIVLGRVYYRSQITRINKEAQESLTAVSLLKIRQIDQWHIERLGDAEVIKGNIPLLKSIKESILNKNQTETESDITKWMKSMISGFDYKEVFICDTLQKIKLAINQADSGLPTATKTAFGEVMKDMNIRMTDLYRNGALSQPAIDLVIPLVLNNKKQSRPFGVIVLRIDPAKTLFPLIQSWPIPSKSAETLLIRKEGDSVLYLNDLRHIQNTALHLKLPIADKNLPAAKAVNGFVGVVEGIDYRNIPVVAYVTSIPGLSWFMVAKVDKEEIQEPLKEFSYISVIVTILLILIVASVLIFWIRNQHIIRLKENLRNELAKKQLDDALIISELRYRRLFEAAQDGILILEAETGLIVDVNPYLIEMLGVTREQFLKKSIWEIGSFKDIAANKEKFLELQQNEYGRYEDLPLETSEGQLFHVEFVSNVYLVNGLRVIQCNIRDITERKRSELKLMESENLFRSLFDNMLNGLAYCKMLYEEEIPQDFIYLNVNKAFETQTGLMNVTGKKVSEVIPGIRNADPGLFELYNRVALTGKPETLEIHVESLNMWFLLSVYSPEREYFVVVFDVISERKKIEKTLKESEEKFRTAFITNPDSITITSLSDGKYISINNGFTQTFGYSEEEVLGKNSHDISMWFNPDDRKHFINSLQTQGHITNFETKFYSKSRKLLDCLVSATIINLEDVSLVLSTTRDITERKWIENALTESEERFRSMYENVTIGMYRTTTDGKILLANPAMVSMMGCDSYEQLAERNLEKEGYEPDYPRSQFHKTMEKEGRIIGLESAWHKKDGTVLYVRESANAIRNNQGRIIYYDGTVEDITDRKDIEKALEEEKNLLLTIIDLVPSLIFVKDREGRFQMVNSSCAKFMGVTSSRDLIGKTDFEFYQSDVADTFRSDEIDVLKGIPLINKEEGDSSPGGVTRNLLTTKVPLHNSKGEIVGLVGTCFDITELKQAEKALIESEEKFKYIFDHSVTGKSITLPNGEIHVNAAFCEMVGYNKAELTKSKWQEISYRDEIELNQKMLDTLISGGKKSVRFIKRYLHKNGSIIWADVGTSLRRDSKGKPLYFMTSMMDITERKKGEEQISKLNETLEQRVIERTSQLELANKELEAFSYSVSHDLRAPLRAVNSYTGILLEDYGKILDDEGKRICRIISSSATQMGELIDDLLSFSRIGRSTMNPSKLDMRFIANSVFDEISTGEGKKRIKFKIGKLHRVYGDPGLIKLVWNNLISNAIKYSSKESVSEIVISSKQEENVVTYSIKDNGVGFDMQYKHKLFGVFQRLHSESEFEGNGVGLAIIRRIIMKHGGSAWAEGEVGKGAIFYFSLPVFGDKEMENIKSQKVAENKKHTLKERQQITDERQQNTEERQQNTEERQQNIKERQQNISEKQFDIEERQLATEKRQTETEEKQKVTEERQKTKDKSKK